MLRHLTSGQRAAVAVVAAQLAFLYGPTLVWLWSRWTANVWEHAHGLLIPPVVAYLIAEELDLERERASGQHSSAWGFAFLVPALALLAFDAGMHTELLSAVSLVLAIPGLSLLFLGADRTRRIAIPLAFLAFALPLPLSLTEALHLQLRHIVTSATAAVVPWFGVTTVVEGTTLNLARGRLEVADACSGFSTLYASVAVATLLAYSIPSTMRRLVVLAVAVPIAIASNVARVAILVVLVAQYGVGVLETIVHPISGVLTFAVSLPVIVYISGVTREARA